MSSPSTTSVFPLKKPNHPRYLNTEFVGHTFPTKTTDDDERQREHTLRHARIHNQLASDPQYAGGIGWCAFDYNTHSNFGCRRSHLLPRRHRHLPRDTSPPPASTSRSVIPPKRSFSSRHFTGPAVTSPSASPRQSSAPTAITSSSIFASDSIESNPWKLIAELDPDREEFEHLTYPPFVLDLRKLDRKQFGIAWGDLRIDGFIKGKQVISKSLSGAATTANSLSCRTIASSRPTAPTPPASSFASPTSSMPFAPTPTTPSSSRWKAPRS